MPRVCSKIIEISPPTSFTLPAYCLGPSHHPLRARSPSLSLASNMDYRVVFTIIAMLLAFLWYRARGTSAEPVTKSGLSECKQILACTGYSDAKANNLNSPLQTRAIPNQRLVRAYDIDNAFTTTIDKRHKDFNKEAGKSISMTEDEVGTL